MLVGVVIELVESSGDESTHWLHQPIPESITRKILFNSSGFTITLLALAATFLVGIRFYVNNLAEVQTFLWPLYMDSPTAIALTVMSVMSVKGVKHDQLSDVRTTSATAYIHAFAFVWLVKYGLWAAIALNVHPVLYISKGVFGLFSYPMIVSSHLLFVVFAFVIVEYGRTTNKAILVSIVLLLVNDVYDYVFGFHPPLEYEPGIILPVMSIMLSVSVTALASWQFDKM